jgi:RNA polymerase sigma-70 factor (ECF subfamily)
LTWIRGRLVDQRGARANEFDKRKKIAQTHGPQARCVCGRLAPMPPSNPDPSSLPAASQTLSLPALSMSNGSNGSMPRWFVEEVHAHDGQLRAYLRGAYPTVRDVDDVVQESYLRTWKARLAHPIASTKSFLFEVARNLAIDLVRRKQSAPSESLVAFEELTVMDDGADVVAALSRQEKIDLLIAALATLPDRTREIVFLRKFQQLPQKEVAAHFGVSERTVETQLAKGMKRCANYLRKRGVQGFRCDE